MERIDELTSEIKRLRRLLVESEAAADGLGKKLESLAPHGTCACSFDSPDNFCLHHSPQITAAQAEIERLKAAMREEFEITCRAMSNVWFTADTHFGHERILTLCNRPFVSIQEMGEAIVERWNAAVKPQDVVIHAGDFAWHHTALTWAPRLHGRIVVAEGNHDDFTADERAWEGWTIRPHSFMQTVAGVRIWVSHYPHRVWPGMHHGVRHVFGHVHGETRVPIVGSMDVGVDAHNFTPVPLEEVLAIQAPTLADLQAELAR